MARLYLHIGAFKTGSTYIQSSLRKNRGVLAQSGLIYPEGTERPGMEDQAWTGGNAGYLFDTAQKANKIIGASMQKDCRGLILSNEGMLTMLGKDGTRKILRDTIRLHRFSETRVLLYLRDPMQLGVSYWLQRVKGHGESDPLDDFLRKTRFIQDYMSLTADVLEYLESQDDFVMAVLNYATHRSDILSSLSHWLEVDRSILVSPDAEKVNRSLDPGEAILQLGLNRLLGPYASFLGKALTERLTGIASEKPAPAPELQESIWEEVEPWVKRINRFLPEGQGLVFDRMESKTYPEGYRFTREQIEIIADSLGGEVRKYWESESKAMRLVRRMTEFLRQKR